VSDNPYQSSENAANADRDQAQPVSDAHAAYNIVTDTAFGPNLRWSDNKFQAICVFAAVVVAAIAGAILAAVKTQWNLPWPAGALIGAFAGLVIGVFSSGIWLMFYRAARHLKGKHD
jgi:hypothetical protein